MLLFTTRFAHPLASQCYLPSRQPLYIPLDFVLRLPGLPAPTCNWFHHNSDSPRVAALSVYVGVGDDDLKLTRNRDELCLCANMARLTLESAG